MNVHDLVYLKILDYVLENGEHVENRTGVDTLSALGVQATYDLADGFPLLTSKLVPWKKTFAEMLWFISGKCDNLETLKAYGVGAEKLWEPWAKEDGSLGPIYGRQWRRWDTGVGSFYKDQISEVVEQIKRGSTSRRLIVSSWQPADIEYMALPPCHVLFQFTVRSGKLHLQLYQRSCDLPIGGPFNIAGYAMLLCMVAKLANLEPGVFIHSIHDAHIYVNQIDGVKEWDNRSIMMGVPESPKLIIHGDQKSIDDFKLSDFEIVGYKHNGKIELPVAV